MGYAENWQKLQLVLVAVVPIYVSICGKGNESKIKRWKDKASRYNLREIKGLIEESDVQVYAIGLFDTFFVNTREEKLGKRWLSEITDRTGGRTLTVDNRTKLPKAAART